MDEAQSELANVVSDLRLFGKAVRRVPRSRFFRKTPYQRFRIALDLLASKLVLLGRKKFGDEGTRRLFNNGCASLNLTSINRIRDVCYRAVLHHTPNLDPESPEAPADSLLHRTSANNTLEERVKNIEHLSIRLPHKDYREIINILREQCGAELDDLVSVLAGYHCHFSDANSFTLKVDAGRTRNSNMHQDVWCQSVKFFIYLSTVTQDHSPFEYLIASSLDSAYRAPKFLEDLGDQQDASLRGDVLSAATKRWELKSFTGEPGTLVVANTSGYHRQGAHHAKEPRILIVVIMPRASLLKKFWVNNLQIVKRILFIEDTDDVSRAERIP